ncbi:chemotaxis protein CheW [Halobacteriales archaeon QS_6_64_34]|nr:MAG: chemotaxis protein CheW [Halobacteriales archaeon QS_6_64_34]
MSDDRMDRAERIRNMREGNRGTDDAAETATDEAQQSPSTDEAQQSPSTDAAPESSPSDGTGDHGGSIGDSETDDAEADTGFSPLTTEGDGPSTSDTASTVSESSTSEAATAASQPRDAAESSGAGDAESDAQAAAQRAAESAADVLGTDGSEADSGAAPTTGTDAETATVPDGVTGASTVPGDITGVELPDQQLLEEAMSTSSVESTEGGARAAMGEESTGSAEVVRVLEFSLGEEYYCLDIEYVEEIVKRETVTRVPNTPAFVDGVVDLRGQITTILEPKEMMDIESEGEQNLIIVFDPEQFEDQGAIGWVVDEVRQVVPVPESDINHPPVDAEYINGVVDREEYDQFVIWVEPEDALAQATDDE